MGDVMYAPCSEGGAAAFLAAGFREFRLISAHRNEFHIFQLSLEAINRVCEVMERLGDLFDSLTQANFLRDIRALTFQQKVDKYVFHLSVSGVKVTSSVQGCEAIAAEFNVLADLATDVPTFVVGAARLVEAFLPADQRLLTETLKFLARIAGDIGFPKICQAMHSAMIENDGKASMYFDYFEGFSVLFPVPYVGWSVF
jgi:hypothetical protein